eukprot:4440472-Prymnesium_polylepis.1
MAAPALPSPVATAAAALAPVGTMPVLLEKTASLTRPVMTMACEAAAVLVSGAVTAAMAMVALTPEAYSVAALKEIAGPLVATTPA